MVANVLGFKNAYSTLEGLIKKEAEIFNAHILRIEKKDNAGEIEECYGFTLSGIGIANFIGKYNDESFSALGVKQVSGIKAVNLLLKCIFSGIINGDFYKEIASSINSNIYLMKDDGNCNLGNMHNSFVISPMPIKIVGLRLFKNLGEDSSEIGIAGGLVKPEHIFNNTIIPRVWLGKKLKGIYYDYGKKISIQANNSFNYSIDGDLYTIYNGQEIIANAEKIKVVRPGSESLNPDANSAPYNFPILPYTIFRPFSNLS